MAHYASGRAGRWFLAWLAACLTVALLAATAAAHDATIVKSDPADGAVVAKSPAQVSATFDEELDTKGSTMKVVDAAGKQVSDGTGKVDLNDPYHVTMLATLPSPLPNGLYTVQWHALLTDGDATDGTFKFTVGAAAAAPTVAATAVQAAAATVAPTVAPPTSAPTVAAAAAAAVTPAPTAQATAAAPEKLPVTGGAAGQPVWLIAVLAVVAFAVGLVASGLRRLPQR